MFWNGLFCCGVPSVISCAQGYVYDGKTCVYTSKGGSTYNCNDGYIWNGVSCVPGNGMNCESGYYWNGLRCVLLISTSGSISGSSGVSTTVVGGSYPICEGSNYWHPASGMCISGYPSSGAGSCVGNTVWNGVGCSAIGGYNQCSSGQYWCGSSCLQLSIRVQTTCRNQQYWDGSICCDMVGSGSQKCASGSFYYKPYSNCLKQF